MKPLFILLTVVSSFLTTTSNANNETASPAAIKSFYQTFAGASEVSWTYENNLYKVSFQLSGQYANAFYEESGELLVTTRSISPLQMPVVLLASIRQNYSQQWISELVEATGTSGTYYFITLEDGKQKIILKSNGANNWIKLQRYEK